MASALWFFSSMICVCVFAGAWATPMKNPMTISTTTDTVTTMRIVFAVRELRDATTGASCGEGRGAA